MLLNDARYPWCVLVPRIAGLTELMQLDVAQGQRLFEELRLVSKTLVGHPGVTKVNVGALGNLVPQLHVHVIGRSPSDAAWPGPVWGFGEAEPYTDVQLLRRTHDLKAAWQQAFILADS